MNDADTNAGRQDDQDEALRARLADLAAARPDALALALHHLGLGDDESVAAYLARFEGGHPELALLDDFLAQQQSAQPQARSRRQRQISIASLLPAAGRPAFAVRGKQSAEQIYAAGPVRLTVRVQADGRHLHKRRLTGLLIGLPGGDYTLTLLGEEETDPIPVIDGNFVVDNLAPAVYDLVISGETTELHVPQVAVD